MKPEEQIRGLPDPTCKACHGTGTKRIEHRDMHGFTAAIALVECECKYRTMLGCYPSLFLASSSQTLNHSDLVQSFMNDEIQSLIDAAEALVSDASESYSTESDIYHGREPSCAIVERRLLDRLENALADITSRPSSAPDLPSPMQ